MHTSKNEGEQSFWLGDEVAHMHISMFAPDRWGISTIRVHTKSASTQIKADVVFFQEEDGIRCKIYTSHEGLRGGGCGSASIALVDGGFLEFINSFPVEDWEITEYETNAPPDWLPTHCWLDHLTEAVAAKVAASE